MIVGQVFLPFFKRLSLSVDLPKALTVYIPQILGGCPSYLGSYMEDPFVSSLGAISGFEMG